MAIELTSSDEQPVRAAAAASLGALAGRVHETVLGPLVNLLDDPERTVRVAAAEALTRYADTGSSLGSHTADLDKKLSAFFLQGDLDERQLALRVAARAGLTSILRQAVRDGDDNLRLEAMKGLFDGSKTMFIITTEPKCIIEAISFGKRYGVKKMVLAGADESAWDVKDFLKEKIASYKIPKLIFAVNEIPRNEMGKANRVELFKKLKLS